MKKRGRPGYATEGVLCMRTMKGTDDAPPLAARAERVAAGRYSPVRALIDRFSPACLAALVLCSAAVHALDFGGVDVIRLIGIGAKAVEASAPIPQETEIQIGAQLASTLLGAAPLVDDEELVRYVNRIGRWLALQTERPDLPWRFGVLDTETVNAFATPGGYVFISRGLFAVLQNEAELAGVLAHEIGHVLRKHHLQAIRKKAQMALAADVAGMAFSGSKNAALLGAVANVGMGLYAQGLDREDEFDADRVGVVVAARAGYEPTGLPAVLATLGGMSDDSNVSFFFGTHPPIADRIALLDRIMTGSLDAATGSDGRERFQRYRLTSNKR
jgi:predicted Zn-dependent protease